MGKVITVALPKGGVGKTTTAVNLAASLALAGKRTLLIDADAFGASAIALGITAEKIRSGLFDVFNCTHGLSNVIHQTDFPFLHVIPANVRSIPMEERLLQMAENRTILKNALKDVRNVYDFIIIDTPPYLRGMTANALTASDSVIIPVRSGHFAIDAVDKLVKFMEWIRKNANPALEIEGVLLTMQESHTRVAEMTFNGLQSQFGSYFFKTSIPKNSLLAESTFYGKPAISVNGKSRGAIAYQELAQEILLRYLKVEPPPTEAAVPLVQSA